MPDTLRFDIGSWDADSGILRADYHKSGEYLEAAAVADVLRKVLASLDDNWPDHWKNGYILAVAQTARKLDIKL